MRFFVLILLLIPFALAHNTYFEPLDSGLTADNPLYFLDRISDSLSVSSSMGDSRKAIQELKIASEKLSEAKRVSSIKSFEKTISLYKKYIESSRSRIENTDFEVLDFADLLYELTNYEYELLTLRELLILDSEIPARVREEYRKELGDSFSDFTSVMVLKTPDVDTINKLSSEDISEFSHRMESIQSREESRAKIKIEKTKQNTELLRARLDSRNLSNLDVDIIVDISETVDSVSLDPIPELPVSATTFAFDTSEDYFKKAVLELRSAENSFSNKEFKQSYYSASFASEIINAIVRFI